MKLQLSCVPAKHNLQLLWFMMLGVPVQDREWLDVLFAMSSSAFALEATCHQTVCAIASCFQSHVLPRDVSDPRGPGDHPFDLDRRILQSHCDAKTQSHS